MHAEHFLERLDRLDDHEVTDALALYYNPPLVRQLLAHAPERGHGDRVAISIDDPREGPFIIVTQTGDFVTTLGRGMAVGDLPIIPRSVWTRGRAEHQRLDEAFAEAAEYSLKEVAVLSRAMRTAGPRLTREAITVTARLSRLMERRFVREWMTQQLRLLDALDAVKRRDTWRALDDDLLEDIGLCAWYIGHLSMVLGSGVLRRLDDGDPLGKELSALRPSLFTARLGMIGPYVRNLWMVGKLGPLFFDVLKQDRRKPTMQVDDAGDIAFGLGVIAGRFSKYRGEIRKLMTFEEAPRDDMVGLTRQFSGALAQASLRMSREQLRASMLDIGRQLWVIRGRRLPPDHPLHFTERDAVPDEVAITAFAAAEEVLWPALEKNFAVPARAIPATALLDREELYLPAGLAEHIPVEDRRDIVRRGLTRFREEVGVRPRPTQTRSAKPERNAPCTCGSGKKYKRCCGA
jgi:hypothetical protein